MTAVDLRLRAKSAVIGAQGRWAGDATRRAHKRLRADAVLDNDMLIVEL